MAQNWFTFSMRCGHSGGWTSWISWIPWKKLAPIHWGYEETLWGLLGGSHYQPFVSCLGTGHQPFFGRYHWCWLRESQSTSVNMKPDKLWLWLIVMASARTKISGASFVKVSGLPVCWAHQPVILTTPAISHQSTINAKPSIEHQLAIITHYLAINETSIYRQWTIIKPLLTYGLTSINNHSSPTFTITINHRFSTINHQMITNSFTINEPSFTIN